MFLQFDECWVTIHEMFHLSENDRELYENLSGASISQRINKRVLSLFFSLPITLTIRSSLINDILRDKQKVQYSFVGTSAGLILSQDMPTRGRKRCFDSSKEGIVDIAWKELSLRRARPELIRDGAIAWWRGGCGGAPSCRARQPGRSQLPCWNSEEGMVLMG